MMISTVRVMLRLSALVALGGCCLLMVSAMEDWDKPHKDSARTFDAQGFRQRAACLCVNSQESEILLISSGSTSGRWVVPGGGVDPGETHEEAAVREAYEEAGVEGFLGRFVGLFQNTKRNHRTKVYVFYVSREYEGQEGRQTRWFTIDEAIAVLESEKPEQARYVREMRGW